MDTTPETRWERFWWWVKNGDPNDEVGKTVCAVLLLPVWLPLLSCFMFVFAVYRGLVLAARCVGWAAQRGLTYVKGHGIKENE